MAATMTDVRARAALVQPVTESVPAVQRTNTEISFFDTQGFELMQRIAKGFAASTLVPNEYKGNLPNCIVALNMANRIGADPLMVMQNLVVVHGRPTWSAQFLIATFNTCGRFSALRYEFFGQKGTDEWGCRAYATEKATGERLEGTDVTIAIAKAEGWYGRNGSKWKTMPQQMLQYRAASWFIRANAPELSMGLQTADEIHDVYDASPNDSGEWAIQEPDIQAVEIDTDTGEIIEPQAAPEPMPPSSAYLDWAASIDDCQTKSDLSRIVHQVRGDDRLSADDHSELLKLIGARQDALKVGA